MINAIHFPFELTGHELDEYLARGWFRMGQTIFTTNFIPVREKIVPVYWLRLILAQVHYGKKQKRLLAINKEFTVDIKPFRVTDELEDLYAVYRASIDFDASPTVESFLLNGAIESVYDTQIIEIRDADELIAAGIFDNGENSISGIMNFYHPAYKAKSLGKYLMLLKIDHAIAAGKTYYYPGYIASGGYTKFDYKLFPALKASEIYDPRSGEWVGVPALPLHGLIDFNIKNDLPEEE